LSGAPSHAPRGALRYGLLTAPPAGWAGTASETGFVSGAPDFCGFGTELDFPTMRVASSRHFGPRDQSKSVSGFICAGEYHRTLCSSRRIRACLSLIAWHRPSPWYNSCASAFLPACRTFSRMTGSCSTGSVSTRLSEFPNLAAMRNRSHNSGCTPMRTRRASASGQPVAF